METYSMVLILENDEIYEEIYILVSAKTNTPYSLEDTAYPAPGLPSGHVKTNTAYVSQQYAVSR